jgi:catechol 2,3-dioxygenase-like lactoylglutathione lyase family enzyme
MSGDDPRPEVAIGHATLRVASIDAAAPFYEALGLRPVMRTAGMAIFELRGGTHLMLFRARGTPRRGPIRSFDLMVDDVDAFSGKLRARGIAVGEARQDRLSGHRYVTVEDPDGHVLTVMSSHTDGRPV